MASPTRSLRSPWLSVALGFLLLVLAGAVALGTMLGTPGSSPSPRATSSQIVTPSPAGSTRPSFVYPTPSPEPTFTSYVVRVGDSLSSIARQYATTARSLGWWNRGTYPSLDPESAAYDPNAIRPGWTLILIPGTTVDDANPPTASPGLPSPAATEPTSPDPSPTVQPTPRPTRSPTPAPSVAPAVVISNGSRSSGKVALTFDMGGRLTPAVQIVQWLIDHNVHATLFPTGASGSATTQGRAAMTLAASHPELFDVGNHSWDHPDFRTLSATQMADELTRTEAAMAPLMGQSTKPWFRPPFGAYNLAVRQGVAAAGWSRLVMWDVDTIDWKPEADGGPTTADIVAKIKANAQGGSIVLMHLGGYNTLDALPGILSAVQAKGLAPATLAELLGG